MKWGDVPTLLTWPSSASVDDAPLDSLPPQESEALDSLRTMAIAMLESPPKPLPDNDAWTKLEGMRRDEMLLRFLRYNGLHVEKTMKQLRTVLEWRSQTRIAETGVREFEGMAAGIPVAHIGEVTENGDGLFFAPAVWYDKKSVQRSAQEIGVGSMFEHMLYAADGPCLKRGTVVVDFAGFSVRNVDLIGLKTGVMIYTTYYPDVFEKVLLVNYPKFLYGVWRAIAPLLDARTASRVMWLSDGGELWKELEGRFPREMVPRWLGGEKKVARLTLFNGKQVEPADALV